MKTTQKSTIEPGTGIENLVLFQDCILDLLAKIEAGEPLMSQDFVEAFRALKYYQTVSGAAHKAFDALAQDNTYAPGPNAAWKILGAALGRVSSDDKK